MKSAKIVNVVNAKGGCGKSTIAMSVAADLANREYKTLLIDMDPQAQITEWLKAGDGLTAAGSLVVCFADNVPLRDVIKTTEIPHLHVVASAQGLETIGQQITMRDNYHTTLASLLVPETENYDYIILDSPNQISPVMANAIYPSDIFLVPFESTKAVKSFANFFKLVMELRTDEEYEILHILSNLSRQPGLRRDVLKLMAEDEIKPAETEVCSCGWLARIDQHGGSIFSYRPKSKGAQNIKSLVDETLKLLTPIDEKVGAV